MKAPLTRWGAIVLLMLLAGCTALAELQEREEQARERHEQAGQAIQAVYDAALPTLSSSKQRHYAQRLYRLTGEARYLDLNREYGQRLLDWLESDLTGLADPDYAARRSRELVAAYPRRTTKQRARAAMFGEWGEMIFARKLLFRLVQAQYHGLLPALEERERALAYLAGVDWRRFLTDPDVLGVYAAQVANQVHYLHQLGIVDLRREVVEAFRQHYPRGTETSLSRAEYRNKLYGMTHFVIAASRYYQQEVDAEEFAWILEEFAADLEPIQERATEDILAEVAMSFLLAGQEGHPAVQRIREALVAAVDAEAGIIPSTQGSLDLDAGEHRNVLAIMVLCWPGHLHPGPDLGRTGAKYHGSKRGDPLVLGQWRSQLRL